MEPRDSAAFVTGGGSGLGAAVATTLASSGCYVTIFDRQGDEAQEIADGIGGYAFEGDVTSEKDVMRALDAASEVGGTCRIVVNCAGIVHVARILGRDGPMALEDFRRTLEVNLVGTFNVMRLAAERIAAADPDDTGERGVIVNTASIAAFEGQVGQASYASSKGGVAALTLPAARAFAQHGIRINAVAPGVFATPMVRSLPENVQTALAADVPFPRRLGRPEEFAEAVMYCIRSRYLNGTCLRLDGATRLPPR